MNPPTSIKAPNQVEDRAKEEAAPVAEARVAGALVVDIPPAVWEVPPEVELEVEVGVCGGRLLETVAAFHRAAAVLDDSVG